MGKKSIVILAFAVVALLGLGIVMLLSTSVFIADRADVYHDVHRQIAWLILGLGACAVFAAVDYRWWLKSRWIWFAFACLLLVLCFVPPLAQPANGSHRWIGLGEFGIDFARLQPSEVAKLAIVFLLAAWMSGLKERVTEIRMGFIYPLLIVVIPIALIAMETDMGTAALLGVTVLALLFIAGSRWWLVGGMATAGMAILAVAIRLNPNRFERVLAFLDLEGTKTEFGLQQWRGLLALGSGGWFGQGLGEGREKLMYLPFAHTDFIFPMIGEEIGAVGSLAVVLCFLLIVLCGLSIARSAPDMFGKLLATGIVLLISLQAVINIGVTTAMLPNKGMPLPFVSYGGSNLMFCLIGVGILFNIYRQGTTPPDDGSSALARARRTLRV